MEFLFKELVPYDIFHLTKRRIGKQYDGGYVIPMEVLKDVEAVVVFGICDEDSFEHQLAEFLPPVPFFLCDPYVEYSSEGRKHKFQFSSVGLAGKTERIFMNLPDFLKTNGLGGKKIFLKIDIEGGEWSSLISLSKEDLQNVVCLVIEFHELIQQNNVEEQLATLRLLQETFVLHHIHANNNGLFVTNPRKTILYPDVVECTYVNRRFVQEKGLTTRRCGVQFPTPLDQENLEGKPDYPLLWWLQNA